MVQKGNKWLKIIWPNIIKSPSPSIVKTLKMTPPSVKLVPGPSLQPGLLGWICQEQKMVGKKGPAGKKKSWNGLFLSITDKDKGNGWLCSLFYWPKLGQMMIVKPGPHPPLTSLLLSLLALKKLLQLYLYWRELWEMDQRKKGSQPFQFLSPEAQVYKWS